MKMTVATAIAVLIVCYSPPVMSEVWTIDRAVDTAVSASMTVASEALNADGARLDAQSAAKKWYPAFSAGTSANVVSDVMEISMPFKTIRFGDYDSYDLTVGVSQLVYDGGRLAALREASLERSRMSGYRADAARLTAAYQAKRAFYTVVMSDKLLEAAAVSVDEASNHLKDVLARRKQGMALEADVLRARLRVSQAAMERETRKSDCEKARAVFRETLGLAADSEIEVAWKESDITLSYSDTAFETVRRHRPEFSMFDAAIASFEKTSDAAKADRRPTIGFSGGFHYGRPGLNQPANDWMHYFTGGIALKWNIWDWGEAGRVSEKALIEQKKIEQSRTDFERKLTRDLTEATATRDAAVRRFELAREASDFAVTQLALTSSAYREGVATETDYDNAHAAYTKSRFETSSAAVAVETADATLEYILGLSYTGGEK